MVAAGKLRLPKQDVGLTTPPLLLVKPVMPVTAQRSEPAMLPRVAIDPLGRTTVTVQPGFPGKDKQMSKQDFIGYYLRSRLESSVYWPDLKSQSSTNKFN